jgi:hypothetical protein
MRRTSVAICLLVAVSACSGSNSPSPGPDTKNRARDTFRSSQETYEYPGCANEDDGCPRLKTVFCALQTIVSKYNECGVDNDCVEASLNPRCTGAGECAPYFVSRQLIQIFETEAQYEIDRYCPDRGLVCWSSPLCALTGASRPVCRMGRCVELWPVP